jgi:hypothetical protein
MHHQLQDGGSKRFFNVIDDFNPEAFGIEVDCSLPSECVIRSLARLLLGLASVPLFGQITCSIPRQADIPKVLFSACAR